MDGSELVGRHGSEPIREQNAGEKRLVDTFPTGVGHWRSEESGWDITKSRDGVSQQKSNKKGWLEERWIIRKKNHTNWKHCVFISLVVQSLGRFLNILSNMELYLQIFNLLKSWSYKFSGSEKAFKCDDLNFRWRWYFKLNYVFWTRRVQYLDTSNLGTLPNFPNKSS